MWPEGFCCLWFLGFTLASGSAAGTSGCLRDTAIWWLTGHLVSFTQVCVREHSTNTSLNTSSLHAAQQTVRLCWWFSASYPLCVLL